MTVDETLGNLIGQFGMKRVLAGLIECCGTTDYEMKLRSDLDVALCNYESRYGNVDMSSLKQLRGNNKSREHRVDAGVKTLDIVAKLNKHLTDVGLTPKDIAELVGIDESQVVKWLQGEMTIKALFMLAGLVNCEVVLGRYDVDMSDSNARLCQICKDNGVVSDIDCDEHLFP